MAIIDISYPLEDGMHTYPSDPNIRIGIVPSLTEFAIEPPQRDCSIQSPKYKSGFTEMEIRSHHGTHLDAPFHKLPTGKRINEYLLDKFENPVEFIDLTEKKILTRDKSLITLDDLFSSGAATLPKETRAIILYTGFCDYLCNPEKPGENRKEMQKRFPFMQEQTVTNLIANYPLLNILGIDSFSFDPSGSNSETHRAMFAKDVLPLETLWNLKSLADTIILHSPKRKTLYCAPISIKGADAAPTRAYVKLE